MANAQRTVNPATTRDLSDEERRLIELISGVGFGRLEHLRVVQGRPVLDHRIRIVRDIKLGHRRTEGVCGCGEFPLKQEVGDFISVIRSLPDAIVRKVEIRHGLPAHLQIEEESHLNGRRW